MKNLIIVILTLIIALTTAQEDVELETQLLILLQKIKWNNLKPGAEASTAHGSMHGSVHGSEHGSMHGSEHGSESDSEYGSEHGLMHGSDSESIHGSKPNDTCQDGDRKCEQCNLCICGNGVWMCPKMYCGENKCFELVDNTCLEIPC